MFSSALAGLEVQVKYIQKDNQGKTCWLFQYGKSTGFFFSSIIPEHKMNMIYSIKMMNDFSLCVCII